MNSEMPRQKKHPIIQNMVGVLFVVAAAVSACSVKTEIPEKQEMPEVPLLPPAVVERISNGDVFLTFWHKGKFEKFSGLKEPRFDHTKPAVVFIHGLFESADDKWLNVSAVRIQKIEPQTNILAVDWSKLSLKNMDFAWESVTGDVMDAYKKLAGGGDWSNWEWYKSLIGKKPTKQMLDVANAVNHIPPIAEISADYLFGSDALKLSPEKTHIIGFSHGSHIGGLIGKKTGGTLRRLTVLDPSTRLAHFENFNSFGTGWDSKSAAFTDMYQTSFWAGTGKAYGHRTFKVLEHGTEKRWLPPLSPGEDAARHHYAPKWFASTVGKKQYKDFVYSLSIPGDAVFQDGTWTGTIISTLPKNPTDKNYDTAADELQP
jgi:hypothetical protein